MLATVFALSLLQGPLLDTSFELVGNRIYLKAELNGHPTTAILDTGAGATIMDLGLADKWKLEGGGTIQASGAGEKTITGRFVKNANLTLGKLSHPVMIAVPISSLAVAEGRPLEIILGKDFLDKYIVKVDYPTRHIQLFAPDAMIKTTGTVVPIHFVLNHLHIKSLLNFGGKEREVETLVDTGATNCGLSRSFLDKHPVPSTVKTTEKGIIGGGVGGFDEGRFARVDSVSLGDLKVSNFVTSLNEGTGGALGSGASFDFLLAGEVLKRMNVLFDYPHKRVVFQPTEDLNKPFEADKTGLRILARADDLHTYEVAGVLPKSSAEEAGLQTGDRLISVDGRDVSDMSLNELREEFRSATKADWKIIYRRGDRVGAALVKAKSII